MIDQFDGALLRRAERAAFHALARRHGARFAVLAPQADTKTLRQRIQARQSAGQDASEATIEVLECQLQWIEPLSADERMLRLDPIPG